MQFMEKNQKILILLLILLVGIYFLYAVRGILFPFFIAAIIAYLVNPLIEKLRGRGFSRIGAIILLFIMLVFIILILGVFGIPLIIDELNKLGKFLPGFVNDLQKNLDKLYTDLNRLKLPGIIKDMADQTLQKGEQIALDLVDRLADFVFGIFSNLISFFMAPVIAFYILKDLEILLKSIQSLVPKNYRKDAFQLWIEINAVLSGFLRGQFLVSVFIAILSMLGLIILQVNFAIILGIIAGIFNIIPYLGPIIGAVPALAIALVQSPIKAVGVIILFTVIQQIESGFVSPRIMGDKVGLHPLTIIFTVLAGGQLGGAIGMIIAVPLAGVVKVGLKFVIEKLAE